MTIGGSKMKVKKILAAGIVRDIEFCSKYYADTYLKLLPGKVFDFKLLDRFERSNGTVIIRIVTPYNNSHLIEL